MKDIVLIGSGNVATHLGVTLKNRGLNIVQVWSKNINNAEILAGKLHCDYTDSINKLRKADLYILAVKDDAISKILSNLQNIAVVHTSGSVSMEVFDNNFENHGVFYPLQTFSKNLELDFSDTPICIEASNSEFENKLVNLGEQLSGNVVKMSSKQRKQLHIAAVFACNFSNHMYTISDEILSKSNIEFKLLLPLINQTVKKLEDNKPSDAQTGPAKRDDKKVINAHLENMEDEITKEIYQLISNAIIKSNE
tara:strand:- start:303 stop:1058 length:756 start_codon:yes stop_codon:yes gene_type:complete